MTEHELLLELCMRASARNLYFHNGPNPPGTWFVKTAGGSNLDLYRINFGGSVSPEISGPNLGADCWFVNGDDLVNLIRKLLPMAEFKASGKWHYAARALSEIIGQPYDDILWGRAS